MREFWMDTDILDKALDSCDLGDWYTARVRRFPHTSYQHLYTKVREVDPNSDAEKDYQDMRKFQMKFIDADQQLRALQAAYVECEESLQHTLEYCLDDTPERCCIKARKALTALRKACGK